MDNQLLDFLLQKVIDYLKMDVEGAEYGAFEAMFHSGALQKVKQLGFEIHYKYNISMTLSLLKRLEEAGFRQWILDHNYENYVNHTSTAQINGQFYCSNLYLINTNYFTDWIRFAFLHSF